MKRKLIAVVVALALPVLTITTVGATGNHGDNSSKVNICHATGSENHPWLAIQIDSDDYDGHIGHGDFDYAGPTFFGKPVLFAGSKWCEENVPPPPVDECPNIEGNQAYVPEGATKDEEGNCVENPVEPENPTEPEEPEQPQEVPQQPAETPQVTPTAATVEVESQTFVDFQGK